MRGAGKRVEIKQGPVDDELSSAPTESPVPGSDMAWQRRHVHFTRPTDRAHSNPADALANQPARAQPVAVADAGASQHGSSVHSQADIGQRNTSANTNTSSSTDTSTSTALTAPSAPAPVPATTATSTSTSASSPAVTHTILLRRRMRYRYRLHRGIGDTHPAAAPASISSAIPTTRDETTPQITSTATRTAPASTSAPASASTSTSPRPPALPLPPPPQDAVAKQTPALGEEEKADMREIATGVGGAGVGVVDRPVGGRGGAWLSRERSRL